jgi:flagellar biosynthetic protein FlhB
MMRLGMSLGKVALVVAVAATSVYFDIARIANISQLALMPMLGAISEIVFWMALKIALVLLFLAVVDYIFQRWKKDEDLKMSKQEVKEEMKRMEGDPLIKQRRQRVARQLALQRINQAVPGADVVVTNPTHFAIALKYDSAEMAAPKVVAKGADYLAARIRQLAAQHGIPIIERKELARGLYHSVDPGQQIPPEYYQAVAEILAYVYGLTRQSA